MCCVFPTQWFLTKKTTNKKILALFHKTPAGAIETKFDADEPLGLRGHMWGVILGLPQIYKSQKNLDDLRKSWKSCRLTRQELEVTQITALGWSGPKDRQKKTDQFLSVYDVI